MGKPKLLLIAASALLLLGLPAQGQRGGGASGAVGHAGISAQPSPSPSRSSAGPSRPSAGPVRSFQRGPGSVRPSGVPANRSAAMSTWERPNSYTQHWETSYNHGQPNRGRGDWRHDRWRRDHVGYGYGIGLPLYGAAFIDPTGFDPVGFLDDDDDASQPGQANGSAGSDQGPYSGNSDQGYEQGGMPPQGPDDGGYPSQRPPYNPGGAARPAQQSSTTPVTDGLDDPQITLVFNDGRPTRKVRNYVLTGSAVFVSENGHESQIPVTALNLPATIAQNRDAGVDFALPGGTR